MSNFINVAHDMHAPFVPYSHILRNGRPGTVRAYRAVPVRG